jgi:hypothetical protein
MNNMFIRPAPWGETTTPCAANICNCSRNDAGGSVIKLRHTKPSRNASHTLMRRNTEAFPILTCTRDCIGLPTQACHLGSESIDLRPGNAAKTTPFSTVPWAVSHRVSRKLTTAVCSGYSGTTSSRHSATYHCRKCSTGDRSTKTDPIVATPLRAPTILELQTALTSRGHIHHRIKPLPLELVLHRRNVHNIVTGKRGQRGVQNACVVHQASSVHWQDS